MFDGLTTGAAQFLASVTSPEEAALALCGGADILDCKDPKNGALGALDAATIAAIVEATDGRVAVSATLGDLPSDPRIMVKAARAVAATGVDIVKAGFFGDGDARAAIAALGAADLGKARLFAVLMADRGVELSLLADLARAGFAGAMLDTADKTRGPLPDSLKPEALRAFVTNAHANGLAAGLAGSLRIAHIPSLVALRPDIIGFRGALCDGVRTGALSPTAVATVRAALDHANARNRSQSRSVA